MIQRYMQKISGPLMDRIDIHIDVPAVNYKEMRSGTEPEASAQVRERVLRARETQLRRLCGSDTLVRQGSCGTRQASDRSVRPTQAIYSNAQMTSRHIRTFCELSADCERLLERAMNQQGLTARAHDRILKVARTVADLDGSPQIEPKHIAEAIQYRTLDRTFWA